VRTDRTSIKKVLVVGLGVSGQSVCELLLRQGHEVTGTDIRTQAQFGSELNALEDKGCSFRFGPHLREDFLQVDQIIVSPGVPLDLAPLQEAAGRGIEIIGELDWAWCQIDVPVVAVTGTNGKTTTTSLIGELLKSSGKRVFVGGNIGTPLSRYILSEEPADLLVLEISSFQLDSASHFRPDIGVLLNVTEDHLDRYSGFPAYADSKFSLFVRQRTNDFAIVNLDDPVCRRRLSEIPSHKLLFSCTEPTAEATAANGEMCVTVPGIGSFSLDLRRTALQGVHNRENIMASVLVGALLGIAPSLMQKVIDEYTGLSHRMEWVGNWRGIDFYDDSKATNVGAVLKALESFNRSVWLLLGGRDKLGTYAPLARSLKEKGKGALVFGEAAPRLYAELAEGAPTWIFADLQQAFNQAVSIATPGDVVLLSPACSSFDQYASYAERGDHFKRLVSRLIQEELQSESI
jgi:UDP-N-acetylmuramoylalanine--D-glutamate ligase